MYKRTTLTQTHVVNGNECPTTGPLLSLRRFPHLPHPLHRNTIPRPLLIPLKHPRLLPVPRSSLPMLPLKRHLLPFSPHPHNLPLPPPRRRPPPHRPPPPPHPPPP